MERAIDRIRLVHVPLLMKRFEEKAADYNSDGSLPFEPHTVLGIKGQFADIWRKIWKLKKALWDGVELQGEQPIELIDDLIAHLLLTRDLLTQDLPEPGTWKEEPKPGTFRTLREVTGHGYDGCRVCVEAREANPELVV